MVLNTTHTNLCKDSSEVFLTYISEFFKMGNIQQNVHSAFMYSSSLEGS